MIKIDFEKEGTINDREFAFITLANTCGKVLANRSLYPEDINKSTPKIFALFTPYANSLFNVGVLSSGVTS